MSDQPIEQPTTPVAPSTEPVMPPTPQAIATPTNPTPTTQAHVTPWSYWTITIVGILTGFTSTYLLTWLNYKRMNQLTPTIKKILIGGFVVSLILIVLNSLYFTLDAAAVSVALSLFPIYYLRPALATWDKTNPNQKARFGWSAIGWGIVGLVLYLILVVIIALLLVLTSSIIHK
jgi:H+/Cl- antiporter ClcA